MVRFKIDGCRGYAVVEYLVHLSTN